MGPNNPKQSKTLRRILLAVLPVLIVVGFVFSAPDGADDTPWLTGWSKRVKLTIDHNDIDAALSNFPISIYLSTSTGRGDDDVSFIFDEIGSNSKKIAVTKSDGTTQLYVEIEKWDSSNEQAWLWTNASGTDSVSSTTDTDLYLYYDNSHADNTTYVGDPNSTPAENVWDSNFVFVSHMRDDPDTSHIRDSTSNNNDGTKKDADEPIEVDGEIGKAQDFDGENDNIQVPASTSFHPPDQLTLEVWGKTLETSSQVIFISRGNGTSLGYYFYGNILTNQSRFWVAGDVSATYITSPVNSIVVGQFQHLVAIYDGEGAKLYIDNVEKASSSVVIGDMSCSAILYISRHDTAGPTTHNYKGILDELRISDIARTPAWIKASYESERDDLLDWGSEEEAPKTEVTAPVQNGLVGYWNMDSNDIYGSTLYDKSGEGNNGTIYGATTGVAGKIKQALQFDGTDDYVSVTDDDSLDITSAITLEAWAKDPSSWLTGWDKRIKLTIDHNDIDSHLSNFPILIYLSTSTGRGDDDVSCVFDELESDANRKKIAITTSDGQTQCYVEIEKWDHASEQAWLWVKVPSVSSSADTDLYLYYDKTQDDNDTYVGDPSDAVVHNVWDANFVLVTHMRDDPDNTAIRDSTQYANDGVKKGAGEPAVTTAGMIGDAQSFAGDDDYISCGDIDETNGVTTLTVELLTYLNVYDDWDAFIFKAASITNRWGIMLSEAAYGGLNEIFFSLADGANTGGYTQGDFISAGNQYHVAMVFNGAGVGNAARLLGYIDGDNKALGFLGVIPAQTDVNTADVELGRYPATDYINAIIDEIRISDIARTAAWIKASYESERDDLLDFGSEETPPKKIILSKGEDAYSLKMSSDGSTLYGYINDSEISTSVSTPTNWHHYVLTYDGSNQKLYIDGTQATSTPKADNINTNLTNLKIGEYFAGEIDEVKIYNRALSASEVLQNYNATKRMIIDPTQGKTIISP